MPCVVTTQSWRVLEIAEESDGGMQYIIPNQCFLPRSMHKKLLLYYVKIVAKVLVKLINQSIVLFNINK